jgi:cysteinyl-tRNA synthetase
MEKMISTLLERGHAYKSGGSVYFRVNSSSTYGSLTANGDPGLASLNTSISDESFCLLDGEKENRRDFALWKKAGSYRTSKGKLEKYSEEVALERGIAWNSHLGCGRPGRIIYLYVQMLL